MIVSSEIVEKEALLYAAKLWLQLREPRRRRSVGIISKALILTGEDKDRLADAMSTEGRAGETNLKNVQDAGAVILIGVDFGSNAKWCGARVLELQIRSSTAHISKFYGGMERCLALG